MQQNDLRWRWALLEQQHTHTPSLGLNPLITLSPSSRT
jgi:hypothetical protein